MSINKRIIIELKSDLCVSSGYSFAGVVDSDICYDENGIPFIPARRIKGVMKEAAKLIGYNIEDLDKLFGVGGASSSGTVMIGDAVMEGTKEISDYLSQMHDKNGTLLDTQSILGLFSSIKAQTSIDETGVADDSTLRFTRVVNQYYPSFFGEKNKNIRFVADVVCDDDKELGRILSAVRHMGLGRNRGLGNVRCYFDETCNEVSIDVSRLVRSDNEKEGYKKIDYIVRNIDYLMLSETNDGATEKFISGKSVLGALAGEYLRAKGLKEPDVIFNEIFLSGKNIFSNLYITDSMDLGKQFIPAPLYYGKLKKTEKYVCVALDSDDLYEDKEYDPENGNQPKKLKGKFIMADEKNNTINELEPRTEIIYHHSKHGAYDKNRRNDELKSDASLYSMEVIDKGQLFRGSIIVENKYSECVYTLLNELLKNKRIRFGKSKSAQYGRCELVSIVKEDNEYSKLDEKTKKVFVVFESDMIIPTELGYSTRLEDVQRFISSKTGLLTPPKDSSCRIYMATKTVTGYNSKINLKKASVPAVAAGSAFEFFVPQQSEIRSGIKKEDIIGSFISEGFGRIRLVDIDDLSYIQTELKDDIGSTSNNTSSKLEKPEKVKKIERVIAKERLLDILKTKYIEKNEKDVSISSSLVGRITLMLKESRMKDNSMDDFARRIASIKRDSERQKVISMLSKWNICKISSDKTSPLLEQFVKKKELEIYDVLSPEDINSLWEEYLSFILLMTKYRLSNKNMNSN